MAHASFHLNNTIHLLDSVLFRASSRHFPQAIMISEEKLSLFAARLVIIFMSIEYVLGKR